MSNKSKPSAPIVPPKHLAHIQREISSVLFAQEDIQRDTLHDLVNEFLKRKDAFLHLAQKYPTPFYVFDKQGLITSIDAFISAFRNSIPEFHAYYAMKVNYHPWVVKTVLQHGMGIDASSGREVEAAIKFGAKDILFTGPGKTHDELEQAFNHRDKVVVNLDSLGELHKLGKLAALRKAKVRAGIRVFTAHHGAWSKFGIPLKELADVWKEAKRYPFIELQGIQMHSSFNESVKPYEKHIVAISRYLKRNFSPEMLKAIKFFDFGGGFVANRASGYLPHDTYAGRIIKAVDEYFGRPTIFCDRYYITRAPSLDSYARDIAAIIAKYFNPLVQCAYYTEPGHIIANNAMHIVMRVQDKKNNHQVILDGGINLVGWEKFEDNYWPLMNLTHPSSEKELPCMVYGNLCMSDDLWGYYCYADKMEEGDVILVPNQGAMSYSLRQDFIKPLPKVYVL